jgi:16S rRNA U516 pseudouridylate synthase RsuA-like enzyme
MDEDRFNIAVRKFLREVGVASHREIERVVRDGTVSAPTLRLRMTLTSEDAPLEHVVETTIQLQE